MRPLVAYLFVIVVAATGTIRAEQAIHTVEETSSKSELRACLRIADRNAKLTQTTALISQMADVISNAETPPDKRTNARLSDLIREADRLQSRFVLPAECKARLFN